MRRKLRGSAREPRRQGFNPMSFTYATLARILLTIECITARYGRNLMPYPSCIGLQLDTKAFATCPSG